MSLRHMEFAVKISELKSFTKAASELGIAQPSLSKSIMLLERSSGSKFSIEKTALSLHTRAKFTSPERKICLGSIRS